jgi:hypothetical protein
MWTSYHLNIYFFRYKLYFFGVNPLLFKFLSFTTIVVPRGQLNDIKNYEEVKQGPTRNYEKPKRARCTLFHMVSPRPVIPTTG